SRPAVNVVLTAWIQCGGIDEATAGSHPSFISLGSANYNFLWVRLAIIPCPGREDEFVVVKDEATASGA
ncbi:hypothetical protein KI387_042007, partial [Taxus chinensis]